MSDSFPVVFNRAADCLHLSCDVAAIVPPFNQARDLAISLTFGTQWMSLGQGRIQYAIKGGQLKLTLNRGQFEPNPRAIAPYGNLRSQSKTEAMWQLRPVPDATLLNGILENAIIGTLIPENGELGGTIGIEISAADLTLTQAENLWPYDIHPNVHAILERWICRELRNAYFAPYLSYLSFGGSEPIDVRELSAAIDECTLSQLINRLYSNSDRDLIHLAQLADLDPLKDLAGGNFIATDLNGINLAGANLQQANFRGSTLTDADLSETNLRHARLAGADLSGAYLSNADLSHSDCHHASFALTNLIGANLRGANLIGVNLSQVKWVGAQLQDAIFGDNSGLTPDVQHYFLKQGAIAQD